MVRGLVYSLIGIAVFLLGSIFWMTLQGPDNDWTYLGGWLLLLSLFLIGPVCFGIGYWHHWRLHPKDPHWDTELGE